MPVVKTACTYDCPDACGLLVEVRGNRVTIRGDPAHPITRGRTCQRIHRHPARLSDPERIQNPRLRQGDGWEEIDWETALDLAADKLTQAIDRYGPASVVHVFGGGSLGIKKELVGHFFRSLGPVTTLRGGVCDEAGVAAQRLDFGDCASHDYLDLKNSRAIVLWGKNPAATGPHLIPFLREGQRRGAPLVLVEVLGTDTERLADRTIRLAPSGDGFLALAVLRWLYDRKRLDPHAIERCENFSDFERMLAGPKMQADELARRADVSMADVEFLSDLYTSSRPVATHLGWGLQRRRSGGRNVRCIDALGMLTGNVGIAGGGVNFTSWRRRGLDFSILASATGRTILVSSFAEELKSLSDPPVSFVYLQGANPVCQFADSRGVARALRAAGFVVVADAFLTDSADCADLFLPVSLMLEEDDDVVGSFNHHHVARVRKAVDPPAGVREDVWIVKELSRRLGRHEDPWLFDPAAALSRMAASWSLGAGDGHNRNPTHDPLPFARKFDTPSGKMRLVVDLPEGAPPLDGFPLVLMTPKARRFQQSQLRPSEQLGAIGCWLHPEAPGTEGIPDGGRARLRSPLGSMEVVVKYHPGMRRDVCMVWQGGWLRFGRGVNTLVSARPTDLGGCTAFYDQRVRVERWAP